MHEASRAVAVGVSRSIRGWDALEWAAAEAWARSCPLRIVHVVSWPPLSVYSCGALATDAVAHGLAAGAALLEEAESRAARVAPGLSIATVLEVGDPASAILSIAADDALIVLGREHRRHRRLPWIRSTAARVARRAAGPVAIIGLHTGSDGAPAARVVALVDGGAADEPVLDLAFGAARRRGLGVTVARASEGAAHPVRRKRIDLTLAGCRARFRGVHVAEQILPHPMTPALLIEARGAALLAVGHTLRRRELAALLTSSNGSGLGPLLVVGAARVGNPAGLPARVDPVGRD